MDEAGTVGVGQWSRLQRQVAALGGKLIAVGDPDQLQPVSDLPGWAVAEGAVGASVVMDTVLRQTDLMDREATEALARGGEGVAAALRYYAQKGAVRLDPEVQADPVGAIARAYWQGQSSDSRIAVAATHRDVAQLNDAIRQGGLAKGAIDVATIRRYGTITRVFTGVEGRREQVEVPLDLGVGERIILTEAHRDLGLPRSSFGTVVATRERDFDIHFDGQADPVTLDPEAFRGLDYGYAATGHKAQGLGVDRVHVLPHRLMNRHAVYVALSRHKEEVTVYGRAGHAESLVDLIAMGQTAGHLDMGADEIQALAGTPAAGMVPGAAPNAGTVPGAGTVPNAGTDIVGLGIRADWQAQGGDLTRAGSLVGFAGDAELMAVAERRVGLLAAKYRRGDPVLNPEVEDRRNYARFPRRVVDDLVARNSVLRARDVEGQLARIVQEPETFLRLYRAAMTHPDLVMLSEDADRGRVYTTREQLKLELETVDLGARLALAPAPGAAPKVTLTDLSRGDRKLEARLDEEMPLEHRDALEHAMAPGRVRLIRGDAGSGKAQVAAETARLHARAGWQVLSVTPTGAGLDVLETAGVERPRTLRRFMAETGVSETVVSETGVKESVSGNEGGKPRVQLDPATVVVLSHANRLGAREMAGLLERVEASGAKLVAFLGGEEQVSMEAGAVMRALEMRVGSAWMGKDRLRDSGGMRVVSGLVNGGMEAENALEALSRFGALVAGGTARRAVDVLADSYVADTNPDRIALTWGRAERDAVTQAIRAKLDEGDPGRAGFERHAALKPGDRIRFLKPSPWVPPAERDAGWVARQVRAGERAEVVMHDDQPDSLVLRIMARGGSETREVSLTPGMELPDWDYAFAGTIHGEGGLVRENVHLLVSPGMTRQVLAAGVAAHVGDIKLVVPSSEARMGEVLTRIVRREGRAETVLDYGFDPCFGAREAMRGHSVEVSSVEVSSVEVSSVEVDAGEQGLGEESASNRGIDSAITRLAQLAGIERAAPSSALGQGLEAEVLAEVIGAAILREGQAPGGKDRLAVERYVRALGDGRDWRRLLRQVPAGLPGQADMLARAEAGEDGEGRLLGTARVLARGALAARALGEERIAVMFEGGLALYGKRAEMARVHGGMDALLPERVDEMPGQDLPDPKERPETPDAGRRRAQRERAQTRRRTRGRQRSILYDGIGLSGEALARGYLESFIPGQRNKGSIVTRYASWVASEMKSTRGIVPQEQGAAQAVLDRPQETKGSAQPVAGTDKTPDYTAMAQELVSLIAAQSPASNALQPGDMGKRLAALLERADRRASSPWSKPGVASMEQLAARVTSLSGLKGEDRALAEAIDRALSSGGVQSVVQSVVKSVVKSVVETPVRSAAVSRPDGENMPQVQVKEADDPAVPAQEDVVPESKPKTQERLDPAPEQLSLPLRPTFGLPPEPTQGKAQEKPLKQAGPASRPETAKPQAPAPGKVEVAASPAAQPVVTSPTPEMVGPPDYEGLGLQVAVAMAQRLDVSDPIHEHDDMPSYMRLCLKRFAERHPDAPRGGEALVRAWAEASEYHRGFAVTVAETTRRTLADGPLPPADTIRAQRKAFIDRAIWNRKVAQSDAEVAECLAFFIHGELFAMANPDARWPPSLPEIPEETRGDMAQDFAAFANIRKERIMDDVMKKDPAEAREFLLKEFAFGRVSEKHIDQANRLFSLAELGALEYTKGKLPESLPAMPQAMRERVAETLRKALDGKTGQAGDAAAQTGKRQVRIEKAYADRALQLASVITRHVDAENPVHRLPLQAEISMLLKQADEAKDLPANKVQKHVGDIARARVMIETRVAFAKELIAGAPPPMMDGVKPESFKEDVFFHNLSDRNTQNHHPMQFNQAPLQKRYTQEVDQNVENALGTADSVKATELEWLAAQTVYLPNLTKKEAQLSQAIDAALRWGRPPDMGTLRSERARLLEQLSRIEQIEQPEAEKTLERIYRNFTYSEVAALALPDRPASSIRRIESFDRAAIARGLHAVTGRTNHTSYYTYAWKDHAQALENRLHPDRARSRARGRGMGMGM